MAEQGFVVSRETAWCPGCGNFGIVRALAKALSELGLKPQEVLFVSGIGQAGKLPHYISGNVLNTLHGRTLPTATGAKLANSDLTVIAVGGDGDGYAEGETTSSTPSGGMWTSHTLSTTTRCSA